MSSSQEVIKQLEQAVHAAATKATEAATGDAPDTANYWAEVTHSLAESLANIRNAYK